MANRVRRAAMEAAGAAEREAGPRPPPTNLETHNGAPNNRPHVNRPQASRPPPNKQHNRRWLKDSSACQTVLAAQGWRWPTDTTTSRRPQLTPTNSNAPPTCPCRRGLGRIVPRCTSSIPPSNSTDSCTAAIYRTTERVSS